jgi:diguanylate cyclase (GGDEF)-like protein
MWDICLVFQGEAMKLRNFFLIYSMALLCLLVLFFGIYRTWVVLPKLTEQQLVWQQREVLILQQALLNEFSQLKTINYDYAIWDDSYEFMVSFNQKYIDRNFLPDTFNSLKIDGSYFFKPDGKLMWGKGLDRSNLRSLYFPSIVLSAPMLAEHLKNKSKEPIEQASGSMTAEIVENAAIYGAQLSQYGVVFFSATQINKSDRSGENVGFLVFLQLMREDVLARLSTLTGLKVEGTAFKEGMQVPDDILAPSPLKTLARSRSFFLGDTNNKPVLLLTLHHSEAAMSIVQDIGLEPGTIITLFCLVLFPLSLLGLVNLCLVKPLEHHSLSIKKMLKEQKLKAIFLPSYISEITELQQGFNGLVDKINHQQKILSTQATEDPLTGIPNRRVFEQFYDVSWRDMVRNQTPLALIIFDIDHFKRYNDHYGHGAGDKVLQQITKAVSVRFCRSIELLARYGGEEFVIVLTHIDLSECELNAQAIQHLVNGLSIPHDDSPVASHVTVSIGMTFLDPRLHTMENVTPAQLFLQADKALYKAKHQGRNCYVVRVFDDANIEEDQDTLSFL